MKRRKFDEHVLVGWLVMGEYQTELDDDDEDDDDGGVVYYPHSIRNELVRRGWIIVLDDPPDFRDRDTMRITEKGRAVIALNGFDWGTKHQPDFMELRS